MADERRDEVLAWMATPGPDGRKPGYKAAARHFGIPLKTVETWGRNARADGDAAAPPRAHARTPAREAAPPPRPSAEDEDFGPHDLTRADDVTFLEARLDKALHASDGALAKGYAGVAKDWERLALQIRAELAAAKREQRQEMERAERAAVRDPRELARRLLPQLPKLLEVADDRSLMDEALTEIQRMRAIKAEGGA